MDEIFHIPQAQKYCHGKFNEVKWLSESRGRHEASLSLLFSGLRLANSGAVVIRNDVAACGAFNLYVGHIEWGFMCLKVLLSHVG